VTEVCSEAPALTPGSPLNLTLRSGTPHRFSASCGAPGGEVVARLTVPARSRVVIRPTASFPSSLYVRRACADPDAEVRCVSAQATHERGFDQVLDAGTYYVFVDAASAASSGAVRLEAEVTPALPERVP
jgi:hypothetical protein